MDKQTGTKKSGSLSRKLNAAMKALGDFTVLTDWIKEQVDKHVQTEAVNTVMRVQAMLDAERDGSLPPGADGQQTKRVQHDDTEASLVQVFERYLEDVAQLSEELSSAQLPVGFQAMVLRELEQEACTQVVELLSTVLRLDEELLAAAEAAESSQPPRREASASAAASAESAAVSHSSLLTLDRRLADASAML